MRSYKYDTIKFIMGRKYYINSESNHMLLLGQCNIPHNLHHWYSLQHTWVTPLWSLANSQCPTWQCTRFTNKMTWYTKESTMVDGWTSLFLWLKRACLCVFFIYIYIYMYKYDTFHTCKIIMTNDEWMGLEHVIKIPCNTSAAEAASV